MSNVFCSEAHDILSLRHQDGCDDIMERGTVAVQTTRQNDARMRQCQARNSLLELLFTEGMTACVGCAHRGPPAQVEPY